MKKPNKQLYRIGVDIRCGVSAHNTVRRPSADYQIAQSIWFFHALSTHSTENHELQLIFFRMARLLRHPCNILFVFDGPGRPLIKRGHARSQRFHWLEESSKRLADAFGFLWVQVSATPVLPLALAEMMNGHLPCL